MAVKDPVVIDNLMRFIVHNREEEKIIKNAEEKVMLSSQIDEMEAEIRKMSGIPSKQVVASRAYSRFSPSLTSKPMTAVKNIVLNRHEPVSRHGIDQSVESTPMT